MQSKSLSVAKKRSKFVYQIIIFIITCHYAFYQNASAQPTVGSNGLNARLSYGRAIEFKFLSLILDSSVGLSAGIQSAGDPVPETLVRISNSAEQDNLSPFDSKIACLCQNIAINNKKHTLYMCRQINNNYNNNVSFL